MKPFKPPAVQREAELDKLALPEPKKAPTPKPPMVIAQPRPAAPSQAFTVDFNTVITQLQNIWEKVVAIELMVTQQYKPQKAAPVVDDTHPAPPYPKTKNGGHPITGNGKEALFIEVPSVEQLLSAAKTWREANGKEALTALVKEFGVLKISELTDEQRAAFMERIRG